MKNTKFFFKMVLFGLAFGMVSCTKTVNVPSSKLVLPNGEIQLTTFCVDESYDKPGEYLAGLGIAEGCPDRENAIIKANKIAINDITSRYVGIIKNVLIVYNKETWTPAGKKITEKKLEGLSEVIGTNVVEKYSHTVCREITQDATGSYTGYVAVHVLLDDLQKGLQEELDVRKVDYDADKLKKQCDAEFAKK